MPETMEELSGVRVKDLISVYESKASATRVAYSRPRAKSLGNLLSKNVIVKENTVITLEDVEKALNKFEVNLSRYSVYNKQKHVELQNQLFNILTSIGNVKSGSESDDSIRKDLTTVTLSMVSSLNQILPSNTVTGEQNLYKYTSYETFKKQKQENERKQGGEFEVLHEQMLPVSKPSTSEVEESAISVKKLRERYQSQSQDTFIGQNLTKFDDEEEYKTEYSLTLKNSLDEQQTFTETTTPATEVDGEYSEVDASYSERDETKKVLSVSKLRMLYERKSEESSKGLQVVLNEDEPQHGRFKFKVNTFFLGKQENDNLFNTISNDNAEQGDMSADDHLAESMNESSYATAYSSINEFEEDSDGHVESDSDPSSSDSTESAIEMKESFC